jgi:hypothetical protein
MAMLFQPFAQDWERRQQVADVERWNWLAVEIKEIRRCAAVGDQAHDRLALLLTDHLVEVIVSREVNAKLAFQLPDGTVDEMRQFREAGGQLDPLLNEVVNNHVWPDQRKEMDNHLHEMTKFLVKKGVLTTQEREVLGRMHEYRNAAYHLDTLEPSVLSDLVLAYMVLASELLERHKPIMWVIADSKNGTNVVTPQSLPSRLKEGLEPDLKAMAARFSDHAVERVAAIATAVTTAGTMLESLGDEPVPDDEMGQLLTELRAVEPRLASWAKRAAGLSTKRPTSLVDLMIRFIGLDRAIQPVEPQVRRLESILDWMEQRAIDELRGK